MTSVELAEKVFAQLQAKKCSEKEMLQRRKSLEVPIDLRLSVERRPKKEEFRLVFQKKIKVINAKFFFESIKIRLKKMKEK